MIFILYSKAALNHFLTFFLLKGNFRLDIFAKLDLEKKIMNNYRAVTESDQIRPGIKLGKKSFQHFKRTFEIIKELLRALRALT